MKHSQKLLSALLIGWSFCAFLEDRLIEDRYHVANYGDEGSAWGDFIADCRRLDKIYNGIVFKQHNILDSPDFNADDDAFSDICERLADINSPYDFNTIPIHILGSIYERFLGSVIIATDKRAHVEKKPELQKAGGVYYTPEYIVRYIVANTVGKLIEGKTPAQVAKMRFADIACGSGSFLLGVYDSLLRWHTGYYNAHPTTAKKGDLVQKDDGLHLSLKKRREILLNNIYGVDIDTQAVEVAQLSLYLKLLQEETAGTRKEYQIEFHETLLPPLNKNIVCGNSLVGSDILDGQLFEREEERRLNPMDYEQRFPEIMRQGGFDTVLGNPPYLNVDDVWGKHDVRLEYLKTHYQEVYNDKTDILFYFLAKALRICKGQIGFIISRAFLQAYKADKLRSVLLEKGGQIRLVDFQNVQIFQGVGITTCICLLNKMQTSRNVEMLRLKEEANPYPLGDIQEMLQRYTKVTVPRSTLGSQPWEFTSAGVRELNEKVDGAGEQLGTVLTLGQGMQTGRNDVFGTKTKAEIDLFGLGKDSSYIRARNSDIQRYFVEPSDEWLIYIEDYATFNSLPKALQSYLNSQKSVLSERAAFQRGNCEWWKYTWPLHKEYYGRARLICPYLATFNRFTMVEKNERILGLTDTTVAFDNGQPESLKYIMALLNSRLLTFRFKSIGKMKGGGVIEFFWNSIAKLPIYRIDFSKKAEKALHEKIVSLVDEMLAGRKQLAEALTDRNKEFYANKVDAADRKIDALVYELYGLTEAEIAVVEQAGQEPA